MSRLTSGTKRSLLILAALGGIIVIGIGIAALRTPSSDPDTTAPLGLSSFGERILVIAPHPDDEVIAPGGLTWEARRAGARVRAVIVTSGDGFKKAAALGSGGRTDPAAYIALGEVRHIECNASLAALGVPPADRIFLGYPDSGMRSLWEFDWDTDRPHLALNGAIAVPYAFAYRPGAPYSGASVAADLERIIQEYQPTSIVYPDANDKHPDHRATAALVEYALGETGYRCPQFTYLAHFGHFPLPWVYLPKLQLKPPTELAATGTVWHTYPLTPDAESAKHSAVMRYVSQVRLPHMNVYLNSFVRRNELFGTYTPMRPLRVEKDAEPPTSADAQDVVVREPVVPVVPSLLQQGSAPSLVRMAVGPRTLWVGVTVAGSAASPGDYAIHLRLLGGDSPARFDATVRGRDGLQVSSRYANSINPAGVTVRRIGDTTWVGVPSSVIEGRTSALVSGEVLLTDNRALGTAWRPVALR